MVSYEFSCPSDGSITLTAPAGQAPPAVRCPECGADAKRRYSLPQLRFGDDRARRLIASTEGTASEPALVSAPSVGTRRRPRAAAAIDPRTSRLPRPD